MIKALKKHIVPLVLLIFIAIYSVQVILPDFNTSMFYGGDDALITWILNQTISKIPNNLGQIFNGNIFYPYKHTMAFSTMMIPSAIIAYLPVAISGSPVTAYNFTILISQILTMILLYLIFYETTRDRFASFVATVAFALSPIRMLFVVHIHIFTMQYFLAATFALIKFKKTKSLTWLYLGFLLLGIQVWENLLQSVWIILIASIIILSERKFFLLNKRHLFSAALIAISIALPPLRAYYLVSNEFNYARSIRDTAHFSMNIDSLWTTYLDLVTYSVLIVSLLMVNISKLKNNFYFKLMIFLAIFGLIMSLGPVLKWQDETVKIFDKFFIPLPYAIFYYLFYPLKALRSVERWIWIFGFGMAGFTALSLSSYKRKAKYIFLVGLLLITIFGRRFDGKKSFYVGYSHEFPTVYQWLKGESGNVILEYPVYFWNDVNHGKEMQRMFYSLYHGKKLVGGASGFMPEDRGKLLSDINSNFPGNYDISTLKNMGVDYIIVHTNEINVEESKMFKIRFERNVVYEDEKSLVIAI